MTINTPIIWIFLPVIVAAIAAVFYRRRLFSVLLTGGTSFLLGALAAFFPDDLTYTVGPFTLTFVENLGILGRQLTITYARLPFIAFIFIAIGLWALASAHPNTPDTFRPISLIITALLTAALGVEPFLYAALFVEAAILFSIPMLSPLVMPIHPSILRYLSLQTLAMPLILLAGSLLSGVESLPPDSPLIGQTMIILGLGFGLWLAIFPFQSWVPMVSQQTHPIPLSFVLFIFPTVISFFSLNFLDRYTFLRESQGLFEALRVIGTLMIVLGGLWTAIQKNVKRAFGFSTLTETGFLVLAVGLLNEGGLNWLLMLYPARGLGFLLWGYCMSLIEARADTLSIEGLQGFAHRFPIISTGILIASVSIAGLPLFASFPIKIAMISAGFDPTIGLGLWIFIGNLGLFFFTIRLMVYLVSPDPQKLLLKWQVSEKLIEYLPILLMILGLIVSGLFPDAILTRIISSLTTFSQLQ